MNKLSFTDLKEPVFDPEANKGLSSKRAYFSLLKSMINTGILYQPRSFYLGGIVFSSIACVLVGTLTLIPILWLSKANDRYGGTYAEIAGHAMGKPGLYILDAIIVITQYGPGCINVGFIIDLLLTTLSIFSMQASPYTLMAFLFLILIPLCLIKSIKDQYWAHILADIIIITSIFTIGIYSTVENSSSTISIITPKYMIYTFGTLVYGFEGIPLLLPIKKTMNNPEDFGKLFTYITITVIIMFLWFSNASNFAYGSDLKDLVILNLPRQTWVAVLLMAYALAVCLTMPLILNPVFTTSEQYSGISGKKVYISRVCIITSVIVIGTSARDYLGLCVSMIGGVFAAPLSLILPAIINLKLNAETQSEKKWSWVVIIFGIFCELAAIFNSIYFNI